MNAAFNTSMPQYKRNESNERDRRDEGHKADGVDRQRWGTIEVAMEGGIDDRY